MHHFTSALEFVTVLCLVYYSRCSQGLNATNIPRRNTPAPGEWPQTNVTGCGFRGVPYTGILENCTEPLDPSAPDIRGYWRTEEGKINELIEMCGTRWTDISIPVIHDFPSCTGVVGDGFGCQDYSGPAIVRSGGYCSPILVACMFEVDEDSGSNCVNLYTEDSDTGELVKQVSRCLQDDGTMIWTHPLMGVTVYTKVPNGEEPNCVKCVGGEHDGVIAYSSDAELPCGYNEREWLRCEEAAVNAPDELSPVPAPEETETSDVSLSFPSIMQPVARVMFYSIAANCLLLL